jgi:hypothetical protein
MKIPFTALKAFTTDGKVTSSNPPNNTIHYYYRLAAYDSPSIANDCDASATRVTPVLQASSTSIINIQRHLHPAAAAAYERSFRPLPPLSQQRVNPGL